MNFNKDFFQPNRTNTREIAEARLIELGYSNFQYTGCSYANGSSFYFTSENGQEIRVSDHRLTGKRALEIIDISIVAEPTQERKDFFNPMKVRKSYIAGEISKAEYKTICKERGFSFKP